MPATPLPEQFRLFADSVARDGAVTYEAICRGIADNSQVIGLLGEAPPAQQRPNLLLAAVHFLLLGGIPHPLAAHYDTVRSIDPADLLAAAGTALDTPAAARDDVVEDFEDFCAAHHAELLDLISVRSTQTNEVGRCAALLPALNVIAAGYPEGQALSLLDLGTSAGLNLLFDSYAYAYRQRSDGHTALAGHRDADVHLECTVRGAILDLPPLLLPPISARVGIDASPIDPTSDDGARWLLACLWPDNMERFARLRGALQAARTTADPPVVHAGDIVDDLARVAASTASDSPLVVFHSWAAAYLSTEQQQQLVETVRANATARPLHYLYAESPVETPGLPTPSSPEPGPTSDLVTALVHVPAGGAPAIRLADMHPHGKWLRWWATPKGPTERHAEPGPAPHRS